MGLKQSCLQEFCQQSLCADVCSRHFHLHCPVVHSARGLAAPSDGYLVGQTWLHMGYITVTRRLCCITIVSVAFENDMSWGQLLCNMLTQPSSACITFLTTRSSTLCVREASHQFQYVGSDLCAWPYVVNHHGHPVRHQSLQGLMPGYSASCVLMPATSGSVASMLSSTHRLLKITHCQIIWFHTHFATGVHKSCCRCRV